MTAKPRTAKNGGPLDCRAAAARCLAAVVGGASLNQQIPLLEGRVKERDRSLYRQLCYGTVRLYPQLNAIASQLLAKPLKNKDRDIAMLILCGGYQLSDTRIPEHAAVSATVAATKELKKPWAKALVNGVLRQWQRQGESLKDNLEDFATAAHPRWLYQAISTAWPQQAASVLQENNRQPPLCLRVNRAHCSQDQYLELLQQQGIGAQRCDYASEGVRLASPVGVEQLPHFADGWASVQDEAPQLSASLLELAPGQRVLDACCAPGGKSCHILESEPQLAELVALDIDPERLPRVRENLQRLQLSATVLAGDAAAVDSWWDGLPFQRILLDAPCSATGVIRRNPDIKLHRSPADIDALTQLQDDILQALWQTLAPGGLLLYATCSILPRENSQQVARFCQQRDDAEHLPITADWGLACDYGRQLLPQADGHDGFFYALLRKKM